MASCSRLPACQRAASTRPRATSLPSTTMERFPPPSTPLSPPPSLSLSPARDDEGGGGTSNDNNDGRESRRALCSCRRRPSPSRSTARRQASSSSSSRLCPRCRRRHRGCLRCLARPPPGARQSIRCRPSPPPFAVVVAVAVVFFLFCEERILCPLLFLAYHITSSNFIFSFP